jgi:hypothetical protein
MECTSKNFSEHTDYIIESILPMFLTIFIKKWFFFRAKKNFDGIFLVEVTKKKLLYQMKVGIKLGKVKKFGIGWCIPLRVVADNTEGGFVRTPPPRVG